MFREMWITFRQAEEILQSIALEWGISTDMLRSRIRTRTIGRARQAAIKRLREQTNLSWREIGFVVGKEGRAWPNRHIL